MKAIYFDGPFGDQIRTERIPPEYEVESEIYRQELIEHLSNSDDALGDMFLEEKVPTNDDIVKAIRRCCIKRTFTPVFVGTALKNKGVQPLLDGVISYLPNPGEVKNMAFIEPDTDETDVFF